MIPALTLEPLSWDDLPEAAVLWSLIFIHFSEPS